MGRKRISEGEKGLRANRHRSSEYESDVQGCQRSPALVPGDVMGASPSTIVSITIVWELVPLPYHYHCSQSELTF